MSRPFPRLRDCLFCGFGYGAATQGDLTITCTRRSLGGLVFGHEFDSRLHTFPISRQGANKPLFLLDFYIFRTCKRHYSVTQTKQRFSAFPILPKMAAATGLQSVSAVDVHFCGGVDRTRQKTRPHKKPPCVYVCARELCFCGFMRFQQSQGRYPYQR